MTYPKLYISYGYPLDRRQRNLFESKNFGYYPAMEVVKDKTQKLRGLWEEINKDDQIMKLLTKFTGINYSRDFELCVFGRGINPMSAPLIMPVVGPDGKEFTDDFFIETIIHELAHCFVNDWRKYPKVEEYWKYVQEKYIAESVSTQNHIIIYAILLCVLEEAFGAEKMDNFLHPTDPDYAKAFNIAKDEGPEKVLADFKSKVI